MAYDGEDAWKDRRHVLWRRARSSDPDVALSAKIELDRYAPRPRSLPEEITHSEGIIADQEYTLKRMGEAYRSANTGREERQRLLEHGRRLRKALNSGLGRLMLMQARQQQEET